MFLTVLAHVSTTSNTWSACLCILLCTNATDPTRLLDVICSTKANARRNKVSQRMPLKR
ncbi:hypothetical protein PF010_g14447 [Phytophthora fragariae]|uniref:Secreted protein n=1 Tax=Phytophthora fragariae TaxID=53985 RepID=A0A6G0PT49_9STRA|nr:hypothetical protein PF010_g14447 [Phytophthora fragariae]KAE9254224.1 hypothetical protein PF004_g1139 [Phytophthora fragariae]